MLLIVYGSLYPWRFTVPHLDANPVWILLHSWPSLALRYSLRDVVVNVSLYIPLGFAAHLVFRRNAWPGFGIYGPVLLGAALSASMELLQLLEPARNTNMVDLLTNVFGTGLGVILGALFEAIASRRASTIEWKAADRAALTLAFCWIAWLLFPLFPALSTHLLAIKLRVFIHSSPLDPRTLVSTAASWYTGGLLLAAAGVPAPHRWLVATLLAIPAQFLIVDKQPTTSLVLGAIVGAWLFLMLHRTAQPSRTEAWTFLSVIVLRGLWPFHFVRQAAPFDWTPFGAMLDSDWQSAGAILIEKIFYYGTAIWLLHTSALKRGRASIVVAATLAAVEIVQIHLPFHTPEITDPLLALVLGFALARLSRSGALDVRQSHSGA